MLERAPGKALHVTLSPRTCRVLLVEDEEPARAGLATMLEIEPDLQVVGSASTGEEALQVVELLDPDVVLIDKDLTGDVGALRAAPALKARSERLVLLLCTGHHATDGACAAPGVDGCLCKDSLPQLPEALRQLLGSE